MITIVDYGAGNVGSIKNMLRKLGHKSLVTADLADIEAADKLILPGVGAFDTGMGNLAKRGMVDMLNEKVLGQKTPILGICLGAQLLTKGSEEGNMPGLGWVDAETVAFRFPTDGPELIVPHMGWNTIQTRCEHPVLSSVDESFRFYFVHSYHLRCFDESGVLCSTHYGYDFASGIRRDDHVVGLQFHPEKSHRFGMQVLASFADRL